ncbi:hypothetical protein AG1IA_06859 [Rhizoctonia solani AG-1 IA]|uniref:Uncharacterized protein n=1 Tax=Thanatephorus cucumeris (strain AG1-IA) TaxID=983506 RepID=L8WMC3_THACA|nr:hypothetical protein AG1IA_06859 [Rhizoctonia solani AG-1 IA]
MEGKMSLTTTMGVKLGPLVLGTLLKHYLERHNVTRDSKARNELLFDEAFIIVKAFMEESTKHTVEELQQFSNARIPSPPWVHCVRVLIPLECCDAAAPLLLQALGGPEAVGGSKWWQPSNETGETQKNDVNSAKIRCPPLHHLPTRLRGSTRCGLDEPVFPS